MKKVISTVGLCAALVVGFAFTAVAGEKGADSGEKGKRAGGPGGQRPDPAEMFGKLDADGNGGVSLEEYKNNPRAQNAPDPSRIEARFNQLDADGSGEVTQEEFAAMLERMKGKGGKGGPAGKGGNRGEKPTE